MGGRGSRGGEKRGEVGEAWGGSAALSLLSGDDAVAPKAPLQLQVLQLLPQLLPLFLLLLLTAKHNGNKHQQHTMEGEFLL